MRRFFLTFLFAFASLCTFAQSAKNVLEIDPSSFRPIQTDVLTGVSIDKIGLDRSKRPCARIKLHINRMTREEIDQIAVHPIGGNIELTKKATSYEGNGLIIEMTAKPQTRFFIRHNKYGDSNEVTVDLEGNKEYYLEAQLDMLYPITVVSNYKGADVYVDGIYKGLTNDNYMLTIEDVVPGIHNITLKYGAATTEKSVDVNSSNVSFRVEINSQSSQPQYVVFDLEPKTAIVFIDNEPQTTQDGVMSAVLQNGTYSYRVIAKGYYEQTGSFTIEGAKVVRKITLKADAAMVTISAAGEDVEIWANNELKGKSPWRGPLIAGTYIFEARKAGHRTTTLSQAITSTPAEQSYTLNAPTPIIGSVDITSTPALADVYIDGKHVGQTPMMSNLLEGKHSISIQKMGYAISEHSATVLEGKTTTVVAMLNKATSVDEILNDGKTILQGADNTATTTPVQNTPQVSPQTPTFTSTTTTSVASTKAPQKESKTGVTVKGFNKKYGYKTKDGRLALQYNYKKMYLTDDFVCARTDKKATWGIYDHEGNSIMPHKYKLVHITDGYIMAWQKEKSLCGLYNTKGELIIPHQYKDFQTKLTEGLLAARKGNKWGYIDSLGNKKIDFKYQFARPFSEGLAVVKKGRYGYINTEGELVMPCKYTTADDFTDGLARVGRQVGYGWWALGIIIPIVGFEITGMFFWDQIKYGYIDHTGGFVIPQYYKSAPVAFDKNGLARVSYQTYYKNAFYIDKDRNRYDTYEEALKSIGKK